MSLPPPMYISFALSFDSFSSSLKSDLLQPTWRLLRHSRQYFYFPLGNNFSSSLKLPQLLSPGSNLNGGFSTTPISTSYNDCIGQCLVYAVMPECLTS